MFETVNNGIFYVAVWTSGRTERSAKSQAMAKIHEATKDEWPEEEFHGLRKSVQQKKDLKTQDSSDSKQNNQNNAWKSKKKPDSTVEEDVGGDDSMAENVRWQSERVEQVCLLALVGFHQIFISFYVVMSLIDSICLAC